MMDWLGKALELPDFYLASSRGHGGGVIQGSASESLLVTLLVAKKKAIEKTKALHPDWCEHFIRSKLVAYSSKEVTHFLEKRQPHSLCKHPHIFTGAFELRAGNALGFSDLQKAQHRQQIQTARQRTSKGDRGGYQKRPYSFFRKLI